MSWNEMLARVMERHGQDLRQLPEEETAAVARQFLEEELLPRLEKLASQARGAGFSADVQVGERLRRGTGRNLERAGIAVSRQISERESAVPVAELEFEYRGDLNYEALHHAKQGRRNSTVFNLAGEPLVHVQPEVERFREDFGLKG